MIHIIDNLPDNVLGVEAEKTITKEDYTNVLIPAIEALLKTHKKGKLLYHIGQKFEKFENTALWEDAKVGLHHFTDFDKIAIVTDINWITDAAKIFGHMMSGKVKSFSNANFVEAKNWIIS